MSWKKHFKPVNSILPKSSMSIQGGSSANISKYSSWLPEIYQGPPDRLQRYAIYEQMNMDHEIYWGLSTLADFSTEEDEETKLPFIIEWNDKPSPSESSILSKTLRQWCILNEWNKRLWSTFRLCLMYGDQFFVRDPETFKLFWVDPNKVTKIIVNESDGKKIEVYYVKDMDLNLQELVASNMQTSDSSKPMGNLMFSPPLTSGNASYPSSYSSGSTHSFGTETEMPIDAKHVVQLSTSDGMNSGWPFGVSVLEYVYKIYKQKELLEDAILIYRVHRAPERRVFFIDVGDMPPNKANQYLERIKYEVQQKRIPSRSGGGNNITDSTYNPMSMLEDYYFAVSSSGRGSKVETLPGGENLGCFDLETKIKLTDGRDLSIRDIEQELNNGEELYTYSSHPITGEVVTGKISWAGRTKQNARVLDIQLSNGKNIICTPDHKFPIFGEGFVEAKNFKPGMALMSCDMSENNDIVCPLKKMSVDKNTEIVGDGYYSRNNIIADAELLEMMDNLYRSNWNISKDYFAKFLINNASFVNKFEQLNGKFITEHVVDKILQCFNLTWESYTSLKKQDIGDIQGKVRILSITELEKTIDVGTLSIDSDEEDHDYHTFLLSAGVFAKNSIDDLKYFNNKLLRALGVPSSYLPSGPEDGSAGYNDGRVGTAFIQEFRFAKVCERYQRQLIRPLDTEFKLFLKNKGITIDNSMFSIKFTKPQNFSEYRQLELDAARINVFQAMVDVPFISKRFALKRYLGLTEEEILENEKLWREENGSVNANNEEVGGGGLGGAGITPSGIEGMAPEEGFEDIEGEEMGGIEEPSEFGGMEDEIDNFGNE